MASSKILITGATGYIGGSILSQLLNSTQNSVSDYNISVLIRGEDKASIFSSQGVTPILFKSLDQTEILQRVASEHDVVIHTASGFDTAAAKALVLGLGQRKQATGKAVHYIHTSGTSNLGDQPITGKYYESHIFSDEENIYAYEKTRESQHTYAQRTTDLAVVETGLEQGVETHIIMSPTIYGIGTGNFNRQSIQIPTIIRSALKAGQAEAIGEGKGIWDYVHIADLAKLYEILLTKILNGEEVPSGEKGIIFSSSGRYSWAELSHGVADALFTLGAIKTRDVKSLTLEEAAEKWAGGLVFHAELGFASNSRTDSVVSRQLGWKPQKTVEDWKANFIEEARLII